MDWLAVTFPFYADVGQIEAISGAFGEPKKGFGNYEFLSESDSGAVLLLSDATRQGKHIIFSGDALRYTRAMGYSDRALCLVVRSLAGKASRLDLALDVTDSELTVEKFYRAYRRGKLTTPARDGRRIKKIKDAGDTLYFGSPTSDRQCRIYDKRAEQKVDAPAEWIRIELQCRRRRAWALLNAVADEPRTRQVINASLRDYLVWESSLWFAASYGEDVVLDLVPRKAPAFMRWLQNQIAPAAIKFERDNPGTDVPAMLRSMMSMLSERLTSEHD